MFGTILFFIYFVGFSKAVLIDTSDKLDKDMVKTNPHGWQMVKMYHPPTQPFGYKYEPYTYPKYEFEYSVSDKKTGDHKHHREARDGDQVRGEYSLVESDGSLRKVQYHADDHNGFNAVVSKTVNKHGDHAISVADHTRFFYPVGHNIKINHYFPGKDYHYQEIEKPGNDKITKPVYEESTVPKTEDSKMFEIESQGEEDKRVLAEPMKVEEPTNESALKEVASVLKAEVAVPVQVIPAIVSEIPQNSELKKADPEPTNTAPTTEKSFDLVPNEVPSENHEEKEDQSDSELASSFYHSKFYYISY